MNIQLVLSSMHLIFILNYSCELVSIFHSLRNHSCLVGISLLQFLIDVMSDTTAQHEPQSDEGCESSQLTVNIPVPDDVCIKNTAS